MSTISSWRGHLRCGKSLTSWAICLVFAGSGSLAGAAVATIPVVEVSAPVAFHSDQPGRPAFLKQVKARFESPGIVGESQSGWFCGRRGDTVWNQATYNAFIPIGAVGSRFRAELEKAGYPVPIVSDAVFEEKKSSGTDATSSQPLQVGVFIKDIALNVCAKGSNEWTGGAYLKLHWQVFAPEIQKVVFDVTTEGSFSTADVPIKGSPSALTVGAFAVAARNFLANPGFLKVVNTPVSVESSTGAAVSNASSATTETLTVEGASATSEPLTQKITQLRSGVATVFGDVGSGTGFFVGTNGVLLTNQHVVGKAKFVKVRLTTGRELVGEVLRSDPARDVALIKTEPIGVPPLAVRMLDTVIGEDVFVLGSPLGDSFNSTLTKGILSGVRDLGNYSFLQSDVAILPGNSGGPLLDKSGQVIGITVMGLGSKGMAGMNFFVPIADALSKLGVQVVPKKLAAR
jgi:S1-C subfamily serine protease